MKYKNCDKKEIGLGVTLFSLFVLLITIFTTFGIYPILHSIFYSAIFVTTITGILLTIFSIKKVGLKNFVGKSMFYFLLALILSLINFISAIFDLSFKINDLIWTFVAIFLAFGTMSLLTSYKLKIPKNFFWESLIVFILTWFAMFLFAGWPQLLNSLLLTTVIMSLRISSNKTHCGLFFISSGIIILVISHILFIHQHWNQIYYLGYLSDITLLISLISIVLGILFINKRYV